MKRISEITKSGADILDGSVAFAVAVFALFFMMPGLVLAFAVGLVVKTAHFVASKVRV